MISYGLKVANAIESILLYFGGISGSGRFMKQYLLHRADTAGCWAKLKNQIKQLSLQTYLERIENATIGNALFHFCRAVHKHDICPKFYNARFSGQKFFRAKILQRKLQQFL